jgi:hypothetical protein
MPSSAVDRALARARVIIPNLTWRDDYEVKRPVRVPGPRGATEVPTTVEAGVGRLNESGLRPTEQEMARRLGWSAAYTVDLPIDTSLTPTDTLIVNGRTFQVGGVLKGGKQGLFATAVVQETG